MRNKPIMAMVLVFTIVVSLGFGCTSIKIRELGFTDLDIEPTDKTVKVLDPEAQERWKQFSSDVGAEFVKGGFWKGDKVQAKFKNWAITVDTYDERGQNRVYLGTYTRIRAPYVNKDGFWFEIYPKATLSALESLLRIQDIEIGHAEFDRDFIIRSNDESKARTLLSNQKICALIKSESSIHLEVKGDDGLLDPRFWGGVDELYIQVDDVVRDVERLKSLYELVSEMLSQLCHMGSASDEGPNITL